MLSTIVEPTDRTDDHATHGHQFDHQSITAHPQCYAKNEKKKRQSYDFI